MKKNSLLENINEAKYIREEVDRLWRERWGFYPIYTPEEKKAFKREAKKKLQEALSDSKNKSNNLDVEYVEIDNSPNNEEKSSQNADEGKTAKEKKQEITTKKIEFKANNLVDIDSKSIGYLDRLEVLNSMKRNALLNMYKDGRYVLTDKENYIIALMQKTVEGEREKYIRNLSPKEEAELIKTEEKYREQEMKLERAINAKYEAMLASLEELNKKMTDVVKSIEYLQKKMRDGKIDGEEYTKKMEVLQDEYMDLHGKIAKINPVVVQNIVLQKTRQAKVTRAVLGKNYATQVYLRSSASMKKELDFKTEKDKEGKYKVEEELTKYSAVDFESMAKTSKDHIEKLEKELPKADSLERKVEIMKAIAIEDAKVTGYEEADKKMDNGDKNPEALDADVAKVDKSIEEDIKEIEKDFEKVEEKLEDKAKQEQVGINENNSTSKALEAISDVANATVLVGAQTALIVNVAKEIEKANGEKAIVEDAVPEENNNQEKENTGNLEEWQAAVNEVYDSKAVKEFKKYEESVKEIAKETNEIGERILNPNKKI